MESKKLRIKELRLKAGVSQTALAKHLNVSSPCVVTWENGTHIPTADKLPIIADFLHCSIDDLFGRGEEAVS